MRFYPSAAAHNKRLPACKRCRPTPRPIARGRTPDVVARSMRLIAEGVVDREGWAARRRSATARASSSASSTPSSCRSLALARAQRAQTARSWSRPPTADGVLAFAAASPASDPSTRQFNSLRPHARRAAAHAMRRGRTCTRTRCHHPAAGFPTSLCPDNLFGHLAPPRTRCREWRDGATAARCAVQGTHGGLRRARLHRVRAALTELATCVRSAAVGACSTSTQTRGGRHRPRRDRCSRRSSTRTGRRVRARPTRASSPPPVLGQQVSTVAHAHTPDASSSALVTR